MEGENEIKILCKVKGTGACWCPKNNVKFGIVNWPHTQS